MHHRWIAAAWAALAALTTPCVGAAQMLDAPSRASDPRGLYVHGHVEGVQFSPEDDDADTKYGYGAGAQLGYNLTRYVGVFVGVDHARHDAQGGALDGGELGLGLSVDDRARFTHLEAGGRLNIPIGRTLLPYADVAYARRTYKQDFSVSGGAGDDTGDGTISLQGDDLLVGLGFQYFIRPSLAFDLGGRLSFGSFDKLTVEFEGESQSTEDDITGKVQFGRLTAGLTWYPGSATRPR
jgi:hypothetical protein